MPLGVNIYDIEQYGRYMMSLDSIGFIKMKNIRISWNSKLQKVIDNRDTINHTSKLNDMIVVENGDRLTIYDLVDE